MARVIIGPRTAGSVMMANGAKTTIDDVWQIIREIGVAQKESAEERERGEAELRKSLQKSVEERERGEAELRKSFQKSVEERKRGEAELRESLKRVHEAQRETQKKLDQASGNFNNKWGEFLENFVEGDLPRLFQKWGMPVHWTTPRVRCRRGDNSVAAEYDLVISNGECIVVIETKTTVSENKLDVFTRKLQLFRQYFPHYHDRKLYGGIAYMAAERELLDYAQDKGLFLIQAPGGENNVTTIANSLDFVPKSY